MSNEKEYDIEMNEINLRSKNYRISLLIDLSVTADLLAEPKEIMYHLKDQFVIKKKYDNFIIDSLDMDYDVYKIKDDDAIMEV